MLELGEVSNPFAFQEWASYDGRKKEKIQIRQD